MTDVTDKPLRILTVLNLPWDPRLGAVRVWMELAEQWRRDGHVVEKYSLSDAYPNAHASGAIFAIRQALFAYKAARFVRRNAGRFDVIDALIGTLPFSKKKLRFHGLLVARSVGLYRLYEEFERRAAKRWSSGPKGKLFGRILYGLTRWRSFRASDLAVGHADLVNVPNEDEAACLRDVFGAERAIIVQPYGLAVERVRELWQAAQPGQERLARKKISFIGMWSARKGAHDWSHIIRLVRERIPDARFSFLGTMIDSEKVRGDLGLSNTDGIEFISDYQPDELPTLLADSSVGAFPSYAEGFGLAVLEQLAAGIPTIAYDNPGPRHILARRLPEFLVRSGDVHAFASAIVRVLELDPGRYQKLAGRSIEAASEFSWPAIAQATLRSYRDHLHKHRPSNPILFVQPFSLGSAGGGARILRALLEKTPFPWQSVCTSPQRPRAFSQETHLRSRPSWGKIEYSKLASLPKITAPFFAPFFQKRLKEMCVKLGAGAIHSVPHAGLDFAQAHAVAEELSIPFFISLHDDLAYTTRGSVSAKKREAAMRRAWCRASARFVISEALGHEYCRRYEARPYEVITDGVNELALLREVGSTSHLNIYFMGLFHMGYEANLRALLEGLDLFERDHPSTTVSMTCRCEHIRSQVMEGTKSVTVLPFANEAQVKHDIENADLLYMPIPFGQAHEQFARYSLSTKMVTYAGSGVPILYHGPASSAAYELLRESDAAIFLTTLVPREIASALSSLTPETRAKVARNGLALAARKFMLADQTRKFWGTVADCLGVK